MALATYLLDTNALSYLFDHATVSKEDLAQVVMKLENHSHNPPLVLGNVEALDELLGVAVQDPDRMAWLRTHLPLIYKRHIVKPWQERCRLEIKNGSPLSTEDSMMDRQTCDEVIALWAEGKTAPELSAEVRKRKELYKEGRDEAAVGALGRVQPKGHPEMPNSATRKQAERHFKEFAEHRQSWFVETWWKNRRELRLSDDVESWPRVENLPCNHAVLSYNLTKIYERLCLGIKDDPADSYDVGHFADACCTEFLVTSDGRLVRTCERAPYRPSKVIAFEEFVRRVLINHPQTTA